MATATTPYPLDPNSLDNRASETNELNRKLQYDYAAQLQGQALIDNQTFARNSQALIQRGAETAELMKTLATLGVISAGQTGVTENQQTVTPVRTATGDAIVGGVGVSAEQVAANVADLATSLVPIITSALATAIAQTVAALVPVVVTASGGASTPSQTQAKPTS